MVDREKRNTAAALVRDFLAGAITSDDLEDTWPIEKSDRALDAIASMIWNFYDDFYPRRMIGKDAASPEEHALLSRYAAYLDSEFEYEWPYSDFMGLPGLGSLVPMSLGLLAPVDRWIKARNARRDAEMKEHGDWSVWPFTSRDQWDGEPLPPFAE